MQKIMNCVKRVISNKALCLKIVVGLIIIALIIFVASFFRTTQYGNSNGNNNNLGFAVQKDNRIYYIEIDDNEVVGISRVKDNGKKIEKVIEGNVYGLNIMDNYIYCTEYNDDEAEHNLIRVKTNGKNKEILVRNIDRKSAMVVDNWVYYFKNNNLYRVKINGTDKEKVSDKDILYYHIEGKWIYYIYEVDNTQYIAKMKLNGNNNTRIAKAEENQEYEALYVKGGKVYYILSQANEHYDYMYYLYRMNKNGTKAKQICKLDTNIQHINMQKDKIYYTVTENYDDYLVKSIKYNGTDKNTITKAKTTLDINITKDWILLLGQNDDEDLVVKMIRTDGKKEKEL